MGHYPVNGIKSMSLWICRDNRTHNWKTEQSHFKEYLNGCPTLNNLIIIKVPQHDWKHIMVLII